MIGVSIGFDICKAEISHEYGFAGTKCHFGSSGVVGREIHKIDDGGFAKDGETGFDTNGCYFFVGHCVGGMDSGSRVESIDGTDGEGIATCKVVGC